MQQNLVDFGRLNLWYAIGNASIMNEMQTVSSKTPFDETVINFLNKISKTLLYDVKAKGYPDVITLAFWMRKASIEDLKRRFSPANDSSIKFGRGVAFHIAPSNVPVNYAYSLVTGLLCGNKNVIRIPSKEFEQVEIINQAIENALNDMPLMRPYICLVKYGHDSAINDAISSIADVRIIWGGDNTIKELRKSKMKPRATEVTFADRYSLTVIDSESYMAMEDKVKIALDFYNDTYLTDQNACTSPRAVIWIGTMIDEAKKTFWNELHRILRDKYEISGVQAVSKLTSSYILAAHKEGVKRITSGDNLIIRMTVPQLNSELMSFKDNSGYFFEYECKDSLALREFCNDTRCQTVSYIGEKEMLLPLVKSGIEGVDRIVPVGKTMDFDFIWDGYNLYERMTRNIVFK